MGRTGMIAQPESRGPSAGGGRGPLRALAALAVGLSALLFLPQCDVTGLRSAVEKKVMPPAGLATIAVVHSLVEILPGETALDFGSYVFSTETSAAEIFVIQNNGNGPLTLSDQTNKVLLGGTDASHFALSTQATETTIQPGKSTRFSVTFKPIAAGKKTATITIPCNASASPFQFTVIGTGTDTPVPQINVKYVSTTVLSGGTCNVGSSTSGVLKQLYFTIENIGSAQLELTAPALVLSGSAAYTVASPPSSPIVSRGSVGFIINFTPPNDPTLQSATLTINNTDAARNPYIITVTGTGIAPDIALYQGTTSVAFGSSLSLGDAELNYGTSFSFSIRNPGTGTLNLTGSPVVAVSGTNAADFIITQPATNAVAAGGSLYFTLAFKPTVAGPKAAIIAIANNVSAKTPYSVTLNGNAVALPKILVTRGGAQFKEFDFGKIYETLSSEQVTFSIQNVGSADLHLTGSPSVTFDGKYASSFVVTTPPALTTIAAGGSTTFSLAFRPPTVDYQEAEVWIPSDDTDRTPYKFLVYGTGLPAPDIDLTLDKVQILSGSSYKITLPASPATEVPILIRNLGHAVLALTGKPTITVSGKSPDYFKVKCPDPGFEIRPGYAAEGTIAFVGGGAGVYSAVFTIPSNDPEKGESPYVVTVEVTVN